MKSREALDAFKRSTSTMTPRQLDAYRHHFNNVIAAVACEETAARKEGRHAYA